MRLIHSVTLLAALLYVGMQPVAHADDATAFAPPQLKVPRGFTIELAAGPPLVQYPMMACLDDRGRLFIAESRGQNLAKKELLEQRGRFIRMLEDTDQDGKFDNSTIFADQLVMPEGALWHRDSLYVVSSPYLWRFEDTDDDGVADVREKLVGYLEFNGKANQHGAYLGPNGRLYFSGGHFGYDLASSDGKQVAKGRAAGVFTCRVDGTDLQVFGNGGINPVEVAFTPEGELLTTCPIFDQVGGRHDALIHWVRGATAGPQDFGRPVLRQTGYRIPAASLWGQVAPSGLMRYRARAFGSAYRDTLFATHFNTGTVVNVQLKRVGSSFEGRSTEFLTSTDPDFHPTDVIEDADGSLLVVDTGGWFLISCPVSKTSKPDVMGAIYRIRKQDDPNIRDPRARDPRGLSLAWSAATNSQLVERLNDTRPFVRDRAIEELVARGNDAVDALTQAVLSSAQHSRSAQQRRNAVWVLSRIDTPRAREPIRLALADSDVTVQQAAARSAGVLRDEDAARPLLDVLGHSALPLRRAAATALGQIGDASAIPHLFAALKLEGDDHLHHALVYALIEIGNFDASSEGLADSDPRVQHAALVAMDQIDGDRLTQQQVTPLLGSSDPMLESAALEIISARAGWSEQIIKLLEEWSRSDGHDSAMTRLASVAVGTYSADPRVQQIVAQTLGSTRAAAEVRETILTAIGRIRQLPDGWTGPLASLLRQSSEVCQLQTISALASSGTKQLDEQLVAIGSSESASTVVRVAAWTCLASGGSALPGEAVTMLLTQITQATSPLDRLAAARAIARAYLDREQLRRLIETLPDAGPMELPILIESVEQAVSEDEELSERFVNARSAAASTLATIRAGDAQIVQRVRQLSTTLPAGDAKHGKAIFFSKRSACSACHAVDGEGGDTGPDLSRIGAIRRRPDVLEAILYPNSSIVNGFETYSVLTDDGRVMQGVIQHTDSRWLVLRDSQRREMVIAREEIDEVKRGDISIMPQGLETNLNTDQLSDLLAYLESLGRDEGDPESAQ